MCKTSWSTSLAGQTHAPSHGSRHMARSLALDSLATAKGICSSQLWASPMSSLVVSMAKLDDPSCMRSTGSLACTCASAGLSMHHSVEAPQVASGVHGQLHPHGTAQSVLHDMASWRTRLPWERGGWHLHEVEGYVWPSP